MNRLDSEFTRQIFIVVLTALLVGVAGVATRRKGKINFVAVVVLMLAGLALFVALVWLLSHLPPEVFYIGVPALAIVTGYVFWRRGDRQRAVREVAGKCVNCGYDHRATETMCPECGANVSEEILRRRRIAAELRAARNPEAATSDDPT